MFLRRPPTSALPPEPCFTPPALRAGWDRVRANKGGPGADLIGLEVFARGLDRRLRELSAELASGDYRPGGLRRVEIPKASGGIRVLAIPDIRDRVAQTAAATHLSRQIDDRMAAGSFGYRPGRGVETAIAALRTAHRAGRVWSLDADIRCFFDEAPHRKIEAELRRWIGDQPRLRAVIALWLKSFGDRGRGLAQGSPISPILANLLLDPLDRAFERRLAPAIRYADDFLVPVASERQARAARDAAAALLRARGLRLNPDKTFIRAPGERFEFLGVAIRAPVVAVQEAASRRAAPAGARPR
jgi:CRISPR-associated protein Cas1